MGESRTHIDLVQTTKSHLETLIPNDYVLLIQTDSADTKRPESIDGYIPDVFWHVKDKLIIGEAKTVNDFERKHSHDQFEAYLNYCKNFEGKSTLIVGVPWEMVMTAKNYFRRLKTRINSTTEVIVINELGQWWSV